MLHGLFSSCGEQGRLSSCRVQVSHRSGVSRCRAQTLEHASFLVVAGAGLSSCDSWALEHTLSSCDSRALEHRLSSCDSRALEHRLSSCDSRALEHRLSSCDSRALEHGLSSCDSRL